jgi:ADP-heptose:LPS heptosyltransferase
MDLPARRQIPVPSPRIAPRLLIHTGAALPVRVWPLDRYRNLAQRLRSRGFQVRIACDAPQRDWWLKHGEPAALVPASLDDLLALLDQSSALVGNDSGPGHLAALLGVPTFTFFGPQLSEWFAPIHPRAEWIDGKPCPHKQCFDYCRYPRPHCIQDISEDEAWQRIEAFVDRLGIDPAQRS